MQINDFTGLGIACRPGFAGFGIKGPESSKLDVPSLFEHPADRFQQFLNDNSGIGLRHSGNGGHPGNEFVFRDIGHVIPPHALAGDLGEFA